MSKKHISTFVMLAIVAAQILSYAPEIFGQDRLVFFGFELVGKKRYLANSDVWAGKEAQLRALVQKVASDPYAWLAIDVHRSTVGYEAPFNRGSLQDALDGGAGIALGLEAVAQAEALGMPRVRIKTPMVLPQTDKRVWVEFRIEHPFPKPTPPQQPATNGTDHGSNGADDDRWRQQADRDSLQGLDLAWLESKAVFWSLGLGARSLVAGDYNFTAPVVELKISSGEITGFGVKLYTGVTPWTSDPSDLLGPRRDLVFGGNLFWEPFAIADRLVPMLEAGYAYGAESFVKTGNSVASGQLKRTGAFIDGFTLGGGLTYRISDKISLNAHGAYVAGDLAVMNADRKTYKNQPANAFLFGGNLSISF